MLTSDGIKVLEYNCRFGDPETQVVLPLFEGDLAQTMIACIEGRLDQHRPRWRDGACATVVLASPGYPGSYPTELPISGLEGEAENVILFYAGASELGGQVLTTGGRVLSVSGVDATLDGALNRAYRRIETHPLRRDAVPPRHWASATVR